MLKKIYSILLLLMLAIGIFIFREPLYVLYGDLFPGLEKIQQISLEKIAEIEKKILNPPPLVADKNAPDSYLTAKGILDLTNAQRSKNQLAELASNGLLEAAARRKLDDIFRGQYFEHISPAGTGTAELAGEVGYEYIILGENLAMGNFESDADLVNSWMQSPGHRENILNRDFTQIGIAVKRGDFEGENTWIAVQEFGSPLSQCPKPDEALKLEISRDSDELENLQFALEEKKSAIDKGEFSSKKEYLAAVDGYNSLAENYNALLKDLKDSISEYNKAVERFNDCISLD